MRQVLAFMALLLAAAPSFAAHRRAEYGGYRVGGSDVLTDQTRIAALPCLVYDAGQQTSVTLTASEVNGQKIVGWWAYQTKSHAQYNNIVNVAGGDYSADWTYNTANYSPAYVVVDYDYIKYNLSYNANGGSGTLPSPQNNVSFTNQFAIAAVSPGQLSRAGYTWSGWTDSVTAAVWSGGETVTGESLGLNSTADGASVVLSANWAPNSYVVTLNPGFETATTNKVNATYSYQWPVLEVPQRESYRFLGWYTDAAGGTQIDTNSVFSTAADTTIYARWIKRVTATFKDGRTGGTISAQEIDAGQTPTAPQAPDHEVDGYYFTGWVPSVAAISVDTTYTAEYSPYTYTVVFHADNGTGKTETQAFTYNDSETALNTVAALDFALEGFTFQNWTNSTGVVFLDGQLVSNLTKSGEYHLYGVWSPIPHIIAFESRGADVTNAVMESVTFYGDETKALPANTFAKTGYTFDGWATNETYATELTAQYADEAEVSALSLWGGADVTNTFYAVWQTNKYTVAFNANCSEYTGEMGDVDFVYDEPQYLPPNAFINSMGHSFICWTNLLTGATYGDGAFVSNITAEAGANVTLYAKWSSVEPTDLSRAMHCDNVAWAADGDGTEWTCVSDADEGYESSGSSVTATIVYDYTDANKARSKFLKPVNWTTGSGKLSFWYKATSDEAASYWLDFSYDGSATTLGASTSWTKCEVDVADLSTVSIYLKMDTQSGNDCTVWIDQMKWTSDGTDEVSSYTVVFDGNAEDAEGTMAGLVIPSGEAALLPTNCYTRTGRSFAGWATNETEAAEQNVAYADGAIVQNLTEGSEITLYAVWTNNKYVVVFDANGGTGGTSATMEYGAALTAPEVEREGYSLDGWTPAVEDTVPASNVVYVAQWSINSYTIEFDSDGGSDVDSITLDFGAAVTAPADPTKPGYDFMGWQPAVPATMPASNMVCKAQWNQTPGGDEPGGGYEPGGGGTPGGDTPGDGGGDTPAAPVEYVTELFPSGTATLGEFTATAAATYNGWLRDADGAVVGTISAKTTAVKKQGAVSKVTIKITPASGKKRTVRTTVAPGGNPMDGFGIVYGALGLAGSFEGYSVEASKDCSKSKVASEKARLAEMPTGVWTTAFASADGYSTFSVTVKAKGKASVKGTLADGSSVSATAQGLLGEGSALFAVPVAVPKKNFGFVLWIDGDGNADVSGLTRKDWTVERAGALKNLPDGTHTLGFSVPQWRDYLLSVDNVAVTPDGEPLTVVSGGRWSSVKTVGSVAADKTGVVYVKVSADKTPANLAKLKLKLTAKTGVVKGSFCLYYLQGLKVKNDKVTVSGIVTDGEFVGSGSVKKLGSFAVRME